jgi:glycosyltransferase involved in cell wall biosynthesis
LPLLTAALIVRDEGSVLDECLASVREVVDEIVVVDTGSLDDSAHIAARHGARVIHNAWQDDFSRARNIGLDAAAGDWILYIDADERLSQTSRAAVERMLRGAQEVAFRLLLRPFERSTPYLEYRIWRHDPRIRFRGVIHEKVTPAIAEVAEADGRPIGDCDLLLTHVGYEGDQRHKHRRNMPLLLRDLEREPDNLFNRHHLARTLAGLDRADEAERVLADAIEVARGQPEAQAGVLVFTDLVRLRHDRGDDVTELLAEARRRYPANKQLWWVEATVRLRHGRFGEALELLDRLLAVDVGSLAAADGVSYDERIFGEVAHDARGLCLFRLGRYAEAAEAYARAAQANPAELRYRASRTVALGRSGRAVDPDVGPDGDTVTAPTQPWTEA